MAEAPLSPSPDTAGGDACADVLTLQILRGSQAGRTFRLIGHSTFLVGRGPGVHLALEGDRSLSRLHFCIEYKPPQARLTDANSKNKTYVNGQPVSVADLRNGDEIQAGETAMRVGLPVDDPNHTFACPDTAPPPDPLTAAFYPRLPAESVIPGYTIERELGRGGMGVVYQARRDADGQRVAVKTVLPTLAPRPDSVGRFQREVSILGRLDHPHIVRFHEAGAMVGLVYFVMEYVEGVSASDLVKREGPLTAARGVDLGCQLLDALTHAHGQGFVHRDVKPGNLLLMEQGGREILKLADFGLARAYQESALSGLTMSGQAGGTAEFMPPEQVVDFHSAKPAADQYAAAATLYYLLMGRHIYERAQSMMELLARILQSEPIPLRVQEPALPGGLGKVICRALSRQPERRYPDVRAMREALRKAL